MKFTTLIPLRFNDGREIPPEQIGRILDDLVFRFGGCSDEGVTKGQWLDPKDQTLYRDESRRVSVSCDNGLLWQAQQAVIKIGKELGQRAMYSKFAITTAYRFSRYRLNEWRTNMDTAKAQEALRIARDLAQRAKSATDLHNAFFGIGGKFSELFPTRAEREAFGKTPEYQEIVRLRAALPQHDKVTS